MENRVVMSIWISLPKWQIVIFRSQVLSISFDHIFINSSIEHGNIQSLECGYQLNDYFKKLYNSEKRPEDTNCRYDKNFNIEFFVIYSFLVSRLRLINSSSVFFIGFHLIFRMWVSPYLRARETGNTIERVCNSKNKEQKEKGTCNRHSRIKLK